MNIFEEANDVLDNFIHNHLFLYHQLRNYDYGVKNKSNISQIAKYTSHRILYEYDIVEKLKNFDKKSILMKFFGGSNGKVPLKITNLYGLNI